MAGRDLFPLVDGLARDAEPLRYSGSGPLFLGRFFKRFCHRVDFHSPTMPQSIWFRKFNFPIKYNLPCGALITTFIVLWMKPGQRLRDAREKRGMSQQKLAVAVGVSRTSVANWEEGKPIRDKYIPALMAALPDLKKSDFNRFGPSGVIPVGDEPRSMVALLGWGDLKRLHGGQVPMLLTKANSFIEADSDIPASENFGLRIADDSMEPRFARGETIIVRVGMTPRDGDYVVARVKSST